MILGIFSDPHINFSRFTPDVEGLDALAIAGDISPHHEQTAEWLANNVPRELPVLMVMGNHDYEGHHIHLAAEHLKACVQEYGLDQVRVLDNETAIVEGVRFVGTTLWTRFDAFEPLIPREEAESRARFGISDFSTILNKQGRLLRPDDMVAEHAIAREFLQRELARHHPGKTVVISHFLPSTRCSDTRYAGNPLNPYFATNVEGLLPHADLWIHGHTHASVDQEICGTRVVCNPRGYSKTFGLAENPEWIPGLRIDLDSV